MVKTRMQLAGEGGAQRAHKSAAHAFMAIAKSEGPLGMYNGLSAGLLRQATYTTTRLGVYQLLEDHFGPQGLLGNIGMGVTAGGVGAVVGNPAEVALVRMTADGRLPLADRRNYSNAIEALIRIAREEGVRVLWRGTQPTVIRFESPLSSPLTLQGHDPQRCPTRGLLHGQEQPQVDGLLWGHGVAACGGLPRGGTSRHGRLHPR